MTGFQCSLDGGAYAACDRGTVSYSGLADGAHSFDVKATADMAGNAGAAVTRNWTVDTTAPTATIDSSPASASNDTAPSFAFSAGEAATFECRLDAGAWAACSSPHALSGLAEGSRTFAVRATDTAGNLGGAASYAWTVDTTQPATTISAQPADPTNATAASFTFAADESVSGYECQMDGGGWVACSSPKSYAGPLAEGAHTFDVRATADDAGNAGTTTSYGWTVDTTAPATTIDSSPADPSNDTAPTFSFSAAESVAGFECSLDGGAFAACTSPTSLSSLAEGAHTFDVRATADDAGNAGTTTSYGWTVDLTAPATTIDSSPPTRPARPRPPSPSRPTSPSPASSALSTAARSRRVPPPARSPASRRARTPST